jgi:hypothetical protein
MLVYRLTLTGSRRKHRSLYWSYGRISRKEWYRRFSDQTQPGMLFASQTEQDAYEWIEHLCCEGERVTLTCLNVSRFVVGPRVGTCSPYHLTQREVVFDPTSAVVVWRKFLVVGDIEYERSSVG